MQKKLSNFTHTCFSNFKFKAFFVLTLNPTKTSSNMKIFMHTKVSHFLHFLITILITKKTSKVNIISTTISLLHNHNDHLPCAYHPCNWIKNPFLGFQCTIKCSTSYVVAYIMWHFRCTQN